MLDPAYEHIVLVHYREVSGQQKQQQVVMELMEAISSITDDQPAPSLSFSSFICSQQQQNEVEGKKVMEAISSITDDQPAPSFSFSSSICSQQQQNEVEGKKIPLVQVSDVIYGREEQMQNIINLLLSSEVSVIRVAGPLGIGKTTLVQSVYNNEAVQQYFDHMGWLKLPNNWLDLSSTMNAIFQCLRPAASLSEKAGNIIRRKYGEFIYRRKKLIVSPRREITDPRKLIFRLGLPKKFLTVIDGNIPMDDTRLLDITSAFFQGAEATAKIIIISRTGEDQWLPKVKVCHLGGLPENECWNLFQKHAFGTSSNHANLELIGKEIVMRCRGLPEAVKMIGSLLRYERDESIWADVLRNMQGMSDDIKEILCLAVRVSYKFMPSHLKSCIAYCTVFLRDHKFKRHELLELWAADGLIQSSGSESTSKDIGTEYFEELRRRLFFRCDTGFEDEAIDSFSMLDLVHDLSVMIEIAGDLPQMSSLVDGTIVYARENDKRKVIELLLSDDCRKNDVSVIRIVAPAGVGKTTLVHLIYNDSTIHEIFETKLWIFVNKKPDVKGVTKAIIESLTGIFCCLTDVMEIQEALREALMGTRFLLVLDNVYDDDINFWSSLLLSLNTGARGSIIIATTRDEMLSGNMDMMHSHKLDRLSDSNCWFVFRQHAFNLRDHDVHHNFVRIGKQLTKRFEGLPLAASAFGGLLYSEPKNTWTYILASKLWNMDKELALPGEMSYPLRELQMPGYPPFLRLSYDHLPMFLQWCFKYCSLFPKGYILERDHLVRLWMSSGFIMHKQGKHDLDIAYEYFDELLRRSFFQHLPICGTVKKYVMHDLFHDLAQSVSANVCYRAETSIIPERVPCHISLVPSEFDTTVRFKGLKYCGGIETLLLVTRSIMKWDASVYHVENPAILDDLFSHLTLLRTLDLSFTDIEVVPESIADLQHLHYLALNRTNIRKLPESICKLCKLQTLELQGCRHLSELPASINNLSELQNLLVWKESGFVLMPSGIGKLTGIQTLSTFTVGSDGLHCGIKELKDLINIRDTLCIGGLWNVVNVEDAKEAELETKRYLKTLSLQWFNCTEDLDGDQSAETASVVLQNLRPCSNLEELTIRDYSGDIFPSWLADPSFSKIISVTLDNCYECNNLSPLGQLPSLKHLSIRMMDCVRRIEHTFCGSGTLAGFLSLETLKLWDMPELVEWSGVKAEYFPCLRSVSISRCNKLKELPTFSSLLELSVHCCAQLSALPTLQRLTSLKLDGLQRFVCLPQLNLPALKFLEMSNCNHLVLLGDLSNLAALEKLKLTKCVNLNLSSAQQLPAGLQVVEILGGCPLLRNWCPAGFEEITKAQQVRRKLVRQKQQINEIY